MLEIRKMNSEDDLFKVSTVFACSWKSSYKGIIHQSYLDSLELDHWVSRLNTSTAESCLAIYNGKYVGVASICRGRDTKYHSFGEIMAIYLLPQYQRLGIGQKLLQFAIDDLNNQGYKDIYLWVFKDNFGSRKFYEQMGFKNSGEMNTIEIENHQYDELRYLLTEGN